MGARLFAYNTGPAIPGASQSGDLAISNNSTGGGSVKWWNGPDETNGYVIGYPDPSTTRTSNRVPIGSSSVGFRRTSTKSDSEFITLANSLTGQNFATASVAADWLNSNGYYTSYSSTSIVTTGLVLNLDAGNVASYPGSGTTWTSLVNGYTGTLGSGVTYSSNRGGVLTFNGTSNATVNMYTSASSLVSQTNNFSIESWYQSNNNFPAIVRTGVSSLGFVFGYFATGGTVWKATKYGVVDIYTGNIPQNTSWHHVVLTYSSTTGTRVYVDGSLSGTPSANTQNVKVGNEFSIGRSESVYLSGSMGIFRWYNAVLSASDVLQNFNADKSRYGL